MTALSATRSRASLLAAALGYADRGWYVFPLRPGTKRPAVPDHPGHLCDHHDPRCAGEHAGWEQRATRNLRRIERAWTHRRYGIGIACGPSHLLVIDLDVPKIIGHRSGVDHLARLEADLGRRLPATFTVGTPRGGQHRYYCSPRHGLVLGNTASRIGPYIDTRGAGGYVVAAPTSTSDGRYRILDDRPPARLPTWFAHLLTQPEPTHRPPPSAGPVSAGAGAQDRYVAAAVAGELYRLTTARPGTRNNTLFTVAVALGQLVGAGLLGIDDAQHRLLEAAQGHVAAGAYNDHQARSTIASGLQRGARQPRRLPANLTTRETP